MRCSPSARPPILRNSALASVLTHAHFVNLGRQNPEPLNPRPKTLNPNTLNPLHSPEVALGQCDAGEALATDPS